jgi:hypothetical protein
MCSGGEEEEGGCQLGTGVYKKAEVWKRRGDDINRKRAQIGKLTRRRMLEGGGWDEVERRCGRPGDAHGRR